ncbi:VOC family protein [Schleiferilactobacillus harbinensis]|jgi:lactoylglutathione lyase|uniref:VOC family protein n=1 Tax=Schleiferilactobacillus harbinensis TaxID=304207 RepID=UPI0024327900|nr:VOC family protein [Schleiferilactobacillus harbinensis]MCI1784017.1 VOC family protein [Schleiferilactobacillus harbinensis]MCI1849546.1 VOC family protein [Schleiferilactobacillus harbinensis]
MMIQDTITGISHIGIPAKDLDDTIAFYQRLGFKLLGIFQNGANRCAFVQLHDLMIETWEGGQPPLRAGAINHVSLNTTDVDQAFAAAKAQHLPLLDETIQSIPSFWDHGIRFFNILGPNHETIEVCQKL